MKVYLGADHRGYELKEKVFQFLVEMGYEIEDFGAYEFDPEDDYTLYADKVASVVGVEANSRGILICGSGVGANVAANKFDGVRASVGISAEQISAGRNDDDMNILIIANDFSKERVALDMVEAFLKTDFEGAERHRRRLEDINRIEKNN